MPRAATDGEDQAAAKALPPGMGPQGRRVADIQGLVSGRPLDEVSLHDFPSMEYADNLFIAGGLGAYVARLGRNLPDRRSRHRLIGPGRAGRDFGRRPAREGGDRHRPDGRAAGGGDPLRPRLPDGILEAVHGFRQGVYEHALLHWPDTPFRGPDRLATLTGTRRASSGMFWRSISDSGPSAA